MSPPSSSRLRPNNNNSSLKINPRHALLVAVIIIYFAGLSSGLFLCSIATTIDHEETSATNWQNGIRMPTRGAIHDNETASMVSRTTILPNSNHHQRLKQQPNKKNYYQYPSSSSNSKSASKHHPTN
jgi:hypothetical protein